MKVEIETRTEHFWNHKSKRRYFAFLDPEDILKRKCFSLRLEAMPEGYTSKVSFHYELIEGFYADTKSQNEQKIEQKAAFSPEVGLIQFRSKYGFFSDIFQPDSTPDNFQRWLFPEEASFLPQHRQYSRLRLHRNYCFCFSNWAGIFLDISKF